MKRLMHFAVAILTACLALLLLAGSVRSGALVDRSEQSPSLAGSNTIRSTSEFSLTRIVTITVGTTSVPLTPGLNSRWQINTFSQVVIDNSRIRLPADAYAISVTMISGQYSIDYSEPAILITNSQGLYYEYQTNQEARRYGNQILISQTYRYNRPLRYAGTVIFTEPYQYVGYAGYAPTQTSPTQLHWDESFPEIQLHQFEAATWLVHPLLDKPDLEIITASLHAQLNRVYVAATIRNGGFMSAGAPAFLNLYDRPSPSITPTGPLDLDYGWCSLTPFSSCSGAGNPLPSIPPGQTAVVAAEIDLTASGLHDIYLYIDALGGTQGLNVESVEDNNVRRVGSVTGWDYFVLLPLVQR